MTSRLEELSKKSQQSLRLIPKSMSNPWLNDEDIIATQEQLRSAPNELFVEHCGWDHHGVMWFDGDLFCEEVSRFHSMIDFVQAATLKEVIDTVNERYGHE